MAEPVNHFDLIIIGAGINGAGIARDAALRGLQVLLLDKGDVGGGTSSWSTRLIHGGLRYLEHAEFGLVRESLRERETLLKIAPHLVRPLPLLIPIYQGARRGPFLMRLGMVAYDLLSLGKSLPRHKMLSRSEACETAPGLNSEGLRGAAVYYDAQVEYAERLVVENVVAAIEHGATVLTYARVVKFLLEGARLVGVEYESNGVRREARASFVINAAGPWVDQILESAPSAERLIGGTKGSHLIVAPFSGAPATALYVEARTDQRPFFIIPWNGNYLIGTTDIRFAGNPDNARIDEDEIEYLLRETNAVIPAANLTRAEILFTYSGVRPLPFTREHDEQSITRQHFIRRHPRFENLFSLVGGKLTTYRSLAEETLNIVAAKRGQGEQECRTASVDLPGAIRDTDGLRSELQQKRLESKSIDHLLRVYGARALNVLALAAEDESLLAVFDEETGALAAEVVHAFRNEFATTLADVLLRRTMVGLNSTLGRDAVEAVAKIAQRFLGLTEERSAREVSDYRHSIARFTV